MNIVAGAFTLLLVAVSGYLAHFVYYDSATVVNNSYNTKRQEIVASQTIRGDIVSSDGEVLATTLGNTGERYYPFAKMFAHVIGYSTNGKMGVELNANMYLVSSNISLNDKITDDLNDEKHMGNTVVTTFDASLQKIAYEALGAYEGAVIVTEPTTGKILAMVSKPDFDPNEIDNIWDELINDDSSSVLLNRATQGLYPPGSTFKILTALEYIRENPDTYNNYSFTCNGRFTSGDNTIKCYHGTNHGTVNFTTSFAKSCNSSFANIGLTLDRTKFLKTLSSLYFNSELPVSFDTKKSVVSENIVNDDSDMIQTAIGQGTTSITPLQLAAVTAMIANGGEMMTPYMIDHVETASGTVIKQYNPESLGQLISEQEAAALEAVMKEVVESGTGTRLSGQEYKVAGKTGSAEYNSNSDSHAWFTGYTYDTDKPLQVTVIMEGAGSGGEYAVPVARRIFDQYYSK
jgi:peptidoglycan glycosyltransferase